MLLTLPSCLRAFSQGCCHPAPLFLFLALQRAFLSSEVCFFPFFHLVPSSYPSGSVGGSVLSSIFYGSYLSHRAHLHVVGMLLFLSFDINQLILPTPFYSAFMSVSVFMDLSTLFHFINSPSNSPLFHSVLPFFFSFSLPYWSFQPYISLYKNSSALIILCG